MKVYSFLLMKSIFMDFLLQGGCLLEVKIILGLKETMARVEVKEKGISIFEINFFFLVLKQ